MTALDAVTAETAAREENAGGWPLFAADVFAEGADVAVARRLEPLGAGPEAAVLLARPLEEEIRVPCEDMCDEDTDRLVGVGLGLEEKHASPSGAGRGPASGRPSSVAGPQPIDVDNTSAAVQTPTLTLLLPLRIRAPLTVVGPARWSARGRCRIRPVGGRTQLCVAFDVRIL